MPANTTPIFPLTQKFGSQTISIANFAKGGTIPFGAPGTTPTFSTILTAGTNGTRIDQIKVRSVGPNSTGVLRLFVNNGTTNRLVHETTLTGNSAVTTRTVTNQTTGTNQFTTSVAHGYAVGNMVYFNALSTLTAVQVNKIYYVSSVPTTTTFTLMDDTGAAVTVGTSISGASASIIDYGIFENGATADYDITISKNTTETAVPVPYLPPNHSLVATFSTGGTFSTGWTVSAFGADY